MGGVTNAQLSALYGGVGLGVTSHSVLNNSYLKQLGAQYGAHSDDSNIFDMSFMYDPELSAWAQAHAADNQLFVNDFVDAWTVLMNADRFEISCSDPRNTIMIDVPTLTDNSIVAPIN